MNNYLGRNDKYSEEKIVDFYDWEQTFFYSVLLYYNLTKSIMDRLNSFMEDSPDTNQVVISWPSFNQHGTFHRKSICPIMREYKGKKYVEFTFAG